MQRFSMMVALAAMTFAAGCNGDDETGATDSGTECENTVTKTFPESGETQAYYRGTIEAVLDDADTTGTITVTDAAGADVAGTVAVEDDRIVFTPSAPLTPSTEYTASVGYECGPTAFSFTTSAVGEPVATPADIVGLTYELDLASGKFVEPAGIESLISEFIGGVTVLVSPSKLDGDSLTITGALGDEDSATPAQAGCTSTIPFPTADFGENPFFKVGPGPAVISVEGIEVSIDDLEVTGAFAADASLIAGATLKGLIDTRPLAAEFIEGGEEGEVCELAGSIGVSCEACPADGEEFCLSIYVVDMDAAKVDATITEYHSPDVTDPPASSTDYCTLSECSAEEECAAAPAK